LTFCIQATRSSSVMMIQVASATSHIFGSSGAPY
jgi:hypothetical protein